MLQIGVVWQSGVLGVVKDKGEGKLLADEQIWVGIFILRYVNCDSQTQGGCCPTAS